MRGKEEAWRDTVNFQELLEQTGIIIAILDPHVSTTPSKILDDRTVVAWEMESFRKKYDVEAEIQLSRRIYTLHLPIGIKDVPNSRSN